MTSAVNKSIDWQHAPTQFNELTQVLSGHKLKILETGPWHGKFSQAFVKQGHTVTAVEPWLGPDARFNSLTELHSQLDVERRPIEVFLKEDNVSRWDVVFAVGLLYHVPSPLHLLELFVERADHIYIDTWPTVDTVILLSPSHPNWSPGWDHKDVSLVCSPTLLDYYMTVVLGWNRGWQGIQRKLNSSPQWTAYYHRNTVQSMGKTQVTEFYIDTL